jgi:putative ubiquitin-RnfH superfamily antitoxin RatB of RatAB toxin-antitoxin module
MVDANQLIVYVIYARPDQQFELTVVVASGATVADAIAQSGILTQCPEIDLSKQKVGKFSRACDLHERVKSNDRIEIYRPLIIDPKDRRRVKAKHQKAQASRK